MGHPPSCGPLLGWENWGTNALSFYPFLVKGINSPERQVCVLDRAGMPLWPGKALGQRVTDACGR